MGIPITVKLKEIKKNDFVRFNYSNPTFLSKILNLGSV